MHAMAGNFSPIESSPEVFGKYAKQLGQYDVMFEDLVAWEDWAYDQIVYYRDSDVKYTSPKKVSPKVWFAHQRVRNTCGTVALLHLLNNITEKAIPEDGSILEQMKQKSLEATPEERGKIIEKTHEIKELHAYFESEGQTTIDSDEECVLSHYVTFVIVDGELYELDGALNSPVNHGKANSKNFMKRVEEIVHGTFMAMEPDNLAFAAIVASINQPNEE
ncbi:Ubiquitin carboxyl-terminal hydrolase isozyme L3 [Babesia sp. Xinjiang]|uniref:Ubiquitin carboxyl-terminal hydrolase isozyme L3 n=1 Tax=Babesia sp. Xinjiang TaxID=462227 RepID=UPI000A216209|nr:Ubiquitin carboxyl-terminal hydrolase isozyme L3 [Babesia sp. Xinjiang]ORM41802.1 Ubiquitin carboxyl-terminal hydrolase isozyme L3 [Babesia sp. Xinjiang]